MINTGIFPDKLKIAKLKIAKIDKLKIAKILPIFKKDDET